MIRKKVYASTSFGVPTVGAGKLYGTQILRRCMHHLDGTISLMHLWSRKAGVNTDFEAVTETHVVRWWECNMWSRRALESHCFRVSTIVSL